MRDVQTRLAAENAALKRRIEELETRPDVSHELCDKRTEELEAALWDYIEYENHDPGSTEYFLQLFSALVPSNSEAGTEVSVEDTGPHIPIGSRKP